VKVSPFLLLFLVVSIPLVLLGLVLIASNYEIVAWRPPLLWSEQYGTAGNFNSVNAVTTNDTSLYAVGELGYNSLSGNGTWFLREYDAKGGAVIWDSQQCIVNYNQITGASLGGDGIYVAANINRTPTLLKYELTGNLVWMRQYAGGTTSLPTISATSSSVYLAGLSSPLTSQNYTGTVLFVREYDSSGNIVWTSEFSNSTQQEIKGVSTSSSGVCILTWAFGSVDSLLVKYDLNGRALWTVDVGGTGDGISCDAPSEYVTGQPLLTHVVLSNPGFLTKYRSDGSLDWSVQVDPPDHSGVHDSVVSTDSSGVYLAVVSVAGNLYLMKYSNQGSQEWSFRSVLAGYLSPAANRPAPSMALSSGGLYLGGSMVVSPNSLAFLEAFSRDGSLIFFGLNPPWSFIAVGAVGAVLITCITWFIRRRRRIMRLGIKRSGPRLPPRIPVDIVSISRKG
jgi:hypothetical protein